METMAAVMATETAGASMAAAMATEASIVAGADAMLYGAGYMTEAAIGAGSMASTASGTAGLFTWPGEFFTKGNLSLAATGISAGGSIMGGMQQSKALAFERAQMETQAEQTRLAAAIDEGNRLARLSSTLAAQRAMAVGRGYDSSSPDLEAIMDDTEENAMADIGVAKLNIGNRGRNYQLGARQTEFMANSAMNRGFIGAGSSLFNYANRP